MAPSYAPPFWLAGSRLMLGNRLTRAKFSSRSRATMARPMIKSLSSSERRLSSSVKCVHAVPGSKIIHKCHGIITCPFQKSYPDIMVVQPGQGWDGDNDAGPLNCPTQRRVFSQGQVRAHLIVIRRIRRKNLQQVCLAKDQHPIEALAPHGKSGALKWSRFSEQICPLPSPGT
jgi:hypothetical protein